MPSELSQEELWELAQTKIGRDALRQRCLHDEWFLATSILGKAFVWTTHGIIFANFFIKKDSSKPIEEQSPIKKRLLQFPRGGFKSTGNVVDCVDWIIHFPDIRILIQTATLPLARAFVRETREFFMIRGRKPTLFQILFPEFCFPADKKQFGPRNEFTIPARKIFKKEATMWAESNESESTGWHTDLFRPDDIVTPENTNTTQKVEAAKKKFWANDILVDPGGYTDLLGTPYTPDDVQADMQQKFSSSELIVVRCPARTLKPESAYKIEEERTKNDYTLLFPRDATGKPRLTWEFLEAKKKANPDLFRSQYLLDPSGVVEVKFDLELLQQSTLSWSLVPSNLKHYAAWDLTYNQIPGKYKDHTVGIIAGVDTEQRIYILEVYRGQYRNWDQASKIAGAYKLYSTDWIFIENTHGAEYLRDAIGRAAVELGAADIVPKLVFFKVDTRKGAKELRVGSLEPLLRTGRLKFVNTISDIQELYREFNLFGSSAVADDIPDAIAHLYSQLHVINAIITQVPPPDPEAIKRVWEAAREKELEEMLFGGREDILPPPEIVPLMEDKPDIRDYWSIMPKQ